MKIIESQNVHTLQKMWRPDNVPILRIDEGEEFVLKIPDSSSYQIKKDFKSSMLAGLDHSLIDAAVGPIFVNGAKAGDILEVTLLDITVGDWGWSSISPDFGLLKGRFENKLFLWDIGKDFVEPSLGFHKNVKIPVEPFLGVIATAPARGEFGMIPPQYFGGNMDNRLLRKGAKLRLPVNVDGAHLSFGDPHACQGDGEVGGTAVETTATVRAVVKIIHEDGSKMQPTAISTERFSGEVIISMGIDPDLRKASEIAVDSMIVELKKMGYYEDEAYVLCSVAGNLRISEIVDEPNFVVSMVIPRAIFS